METCIVGDFNRTECNTGGFQIKLQTGKIWYFSETKKAENLTVKGVTVKINSKEKSSRYVSTCKMEGNGNIWFTAH